MRPASFFTARFLFAMLALGGALLPARAGAEAPAATTPAQIDRAVAAYLQGEGAGDTGVPVDPRLHLAACPAPLSIARRGDRSLAVGCGGDWRIFVRTSGASGALPVAAGAPAEAPLVVKLKVPLARGSMVSAADLELVPASDRLTVDTVRSIETAAGLKMRRSAMPGTVLRLSMLERPPLIMRGDRVSLRAAGEHFAVVVEAEAMQDGAEGDRVTVRNLSSGEKIQGRVTADGSVLISS